MKLRIRHQTAYRFDHPVFLEPHVVRLRPRIDAGVWPLEVHLDVEPTPAMRTEYLDPEGNVVTQIWFDRTTDHLTIRSQSTVETLLIDPFRYLLDHPERMLPDLYSEDLANRLVAYLGAPEAVPATVRELALTTAAEVAYRPEKFPTALAARLHHEFEVETRYEGPAHAPETTLAAHRGACRDLAVLFNECCHAMGLAARFVSGYAHVDGDHDHELHAWSEVYLPGGGWRAYDPTLGLACADRHIAVAAAAAPADAAPVSGSYRGAATATLTSSVEVTAAA